MLTSSLLAKFLHNSKKYQICFVAVAFFVMVEFQAVNELIANEALVGKESVLYIHIDII